MSVRKLVGGLGLALYTVARAARYSVPTFADALTGSISRSRVDDRCAAFAHDVVTRSRMQLTVSGADEILTDRAYVYMSNHQSHIDIPVLYYVIPSRTVRMVAKSELFKIPMWGRAMRAAEFIEVNRADKAQAVESINRAGDLISDGVSVWIAPEGTRSKTGRIGRLKKGGFHLALNTGTPIVPIAIKGTINVLPSGGRSMAFDVPVDVTFGAPIAAHDKSIGDLMQEVESFLRTHVEDSA